MRSIQFVQAIALSIALWVFIILAILLVGCGKQSPTAPEATAQSTRSAAEQLEVKPVWPQHHNIPAVLPDGQVGWVCETKPRRYVKPDGTAEWTLDHYILLNGTVGCPVTPVD